MNQIVGIWDCLSLLEGRSREYILFYFGILAAGCTLVEFEQSECGKPFQI